MSLEGNVVKGKVHNCSIKTTLSSRYPKLSSWFLRVLEENKRKIEKGKHDEDNSSRELDDLISSPLKGRQNLMKKTKYEGNKFERFCEQQVD